MSSAPLADPSLVNRCIRLIAGVDEAQLPVRDLRIAGIEGKAAARILSRDPKGPSTRVVNLPAGWQIPQPGAFTARLELFVVRGSVQIEGEQLGRLGYACLPKGARVQSMGSESGALTLLWLGEPVRFDRDAPGREAGPQLVDPAGIVWATAMADEGVLHKELATCGGIMTSLVATVHRRARQWSAHSSDEECFVLDGEMTTVDCENDEEVSHSYRPGGYVYRPAGCWHGGTRSGTVRTAVIVHRLALGAATTYRDDACAEPD